MKFTEHLNDRCARARLWSATVGAALLFVSGTRANPVFDWTALMIDAIRGDNSGPTLSSRNLAILHTAMFDAINSVTPTYQPYAFQVTAPAGALEEGTAVGAAHEIITFLYPGIEARADQMLAEFSWKHEDEPGLESSIQLGRDVAQLMLALRQGDGSSTDVPYIPSLDPGMWRRTPPFFRPPVSPQWRYVDCFAVPEMDGFLPKDPPALGSAEYARAYNEVKLLGAKNSGARTAEQTEIAHFWSDFSYTSMPPGHWHLIAITIAREKNEKLLESARLFALLSIAQADSAIVCWEIKYRHNLWRPVTAIQRANEDGNEATEADSAWESLLPAPPFPSYTSGHSTFSAASGAVLRNFYGTDEIAFSATADGLPGVTRTFTSLTQCVDEIGMSRIYGGIHYSFDNLEGKKSGRKIGDFVSWNYLLPNARLPLVVSDVSGTAARVHATANSEVITEVSNDLIHWMPISTNTATLGGFVIRENTAAAMRFYRARQQQAQISASRLER